MPAVDQLIGPERTARVINPLVRELMREDLLPEATAYQIVCEGVLAGDPWWLAEPGQAWQRRADADPACGPQLLFIAHRDRDQLSVELEDDDATRMHLPLCTLTSYELTSWWWMRDDDNPRPTS
ncbi:hypothetical protein QFZ75_000037 [Streptomyces sp. V3I8]|uniref:hypothetical protein n=1 Tax=Streptomyces sp. V3I8 TaxID=3042279 RepID=UPI00277E1C8B|nr:hypothetical protein [Streptomyces sp. V3I8]MDQ1033621.1 hypothetical protein [Streptomyces sp. V3I8]